MILIAAAVVLTVGAVVYTLFVRQKDLPAPEPVSPFEHLEERKATIYDNLRDLQFEYRVGKLSDQDYQQTKKDLQRELAGVMAEIDKIRGAAGKPAAAKPAAAAKPPAGVKPAPAAKNGQGETAPACECPHCGATFEKALKFCGECGKPMAVEVK